MEEGEGGRRGREGEGVVGVKGRMEGRRDGVMGGRKGSEFFSGQFVAFIK